ncbi:hypothetical protein BDZ91DRAFT_725924 [Kalaharituber pfeilii]|nr:hypothetical protein BDZ91DRAFT_725924 [Kalaharituber pfeilii]
MYPGLYTWKDPSSIFIKRLLCRLFHIHPLYMYFHVYACIILRWCTPTSGLIQCTRHVM